MKLYPPELKASLIARMLPPNNVNIAELARETGIPKNTLYSWHSQARRGSTSADEEKNSAGLSSQEKFTIVLETASLNEVELSIAAAKGYSLTKSRLGVRPVNWPITHAMTKRTARNYEPKPPRSNVWMRS